MNSLSSPSILMICIILAVTSGCKKSLNHSSDESSLTTWGGKAHRFVDLPGYVTEFFIDNSPAGQTSPFCSGVHIGDGYILTAAHCLESYLNCAINLKDVFINVMTSSPEGQREQRLALADASGIAVHAEYLSSHKRMLHDIALIKTDLAIVELAHLPEHPPTTLHPRRASGEWWVYGVGGSFVHQSHHQQPRAHASYFGGVVSADSPADSQASGDELAQWKRAASTHPLLTEEGRAYLHHISAPEAARASSEQPSSPASSTKPSSPLPTPDHADDSAGLSTVATATVPSPYLFGKTPIAGPPDQQPEIVIYPGNSAHPDAADMICPGDSGGPLIFRPRDDQSQDILLGLISTATKHLNLRSVKDLVMHYNVAGEMLVSSSTEFTLSSDCARFSTAEQQLYREGSLFGRTAAVNVWYYRSWIESAKQSLSSGRGRPASVCSSQGAQQDL